MIAATCNVGMRAIGFVATLAIATAATAGDFSECRHYFIGGKPPVVSKAAGKPRALCFDGFAVLHSGESKTPIYVAERLTQQDLQREPQERTDRFYEEARLPSAERAALSDYRTTDRLGRHYDRGHMAPAADMTTPNAMAQSFSLANMVPQAPENNRGIWAKNVEKPTRQYAKRAGEVFVITGPLYEGNVGTLGAGRVWIPSHVFKVVHDPASGKTWAYIVKNTDDAVMDAPVSYAEFVRRTGIKIF